MCVFILSFEYGCTARIYIDICHSHNKDGTAETGAETGAETDASRDFLNPDTRDIIFMKFDADLMIKGNCHYSNELKKMLQVNAVPVMFGFVDGKPVGTVHGADMKEI